MPLATLPFKRWCLPFLLLVGLCPALAQEDFRFFIERVDIRGAENIPRELLLAEARLREGDIYKESQLRAAQQRLNRLTFVLDSNISLEKGSERGKYVLVLTIEETERWFFDVDGFLENDFGDRYDNEIDDDRLSIGIGYRWFLRGEDMVYAIVRPTYRNDSDPSFTTDATLGYAHYNLFDKNVFFNLQLDFEDEIEEYDTFEGFSFRNSRKREAHVEGELNLHVPLSSNKFWKTSLRVDQQDREISTGEFLNVPFRSEVFLDRMRLSTFWEYNTVDDNLLPNKGTVFQVGLAFANWDGEQTINGVLGDTSADSVAVFSNYRRFYRAGQRHYFSWGTGVEVGSQEIEFLRDNRFLGLEPTTDTIDTDYFAIRLEGSYKFMLLSESKRSGFGDLWLETGFNLIGRDDIGVTLFGPLPDNRPVNLGAENEDLEAYSISLNYRGKWGVLRLSFLGEW